MGTCFPYPGSIGCELANSPARSMQYQVFTGSPFLDTIRWYAVGINDGNALI